MDRTISRSSTHGGEVVRDADGRVAKRDRATKAGTLRHPIRGHLASGRGSFTVALGKLTRKWGEPLIATADLVDE